MAAGAPDQERLLDKDRLEGAPAHRKTDALDWDDPVWARKAHDHYNVPPFWI